MCSRQVFVYPPVTHSNRAVQVERHSITLKRPSQVRVLFQALKVSPSLSRPVGRVFVLALPRRLGDRSSPAVKCPRCGDGRQWARGAELTATLVDASTPPPLPSHNQLS